MSEDDFQISRPADELRQNLPRRVLPEQVPVDESLDPKNVDFFFPMDSYRPGQREAIETILNAFNDGKKFILIEAPTGSGKSVIAYTVAQYFQTSYWLTIQKILQDQITRDFGEKGKFTKRSPVIDLKGRNSYPCNFWERNITKAKQEESYDRWTADKKRIYNGLASDVNCDTGYCKKNGKGKDAFCFPGPMKSEGGFLLIDGIYSYCPYWQRKAEALSAQICLMNFSSFLFQTRAARDFGGRDLMIIDEAHNAESQLMSFIELVISDRDFLSDGIKFPTLETPIEYAEFFLENEIDKLITQKINLAKVEQKSKEEDQWKQILLKYSIFINSVDEDNWVMELEEKKGKVFGKKKSIYLNLRFKPIFINKYAQKYMFSMSDKILMMSATILSPKIMCKSLGIDSKEMFSFRMKNRFPVENRKIIFDPCGSLNMKNKKETYPKLIKKVNDICKSHRDERGIIHTHNFEIAQLLTDGCDADVTDRFLFQKEWNNKSEMLKYHEDNTNTIIIAPAMHEGLDLKDDLARFAIICKVPYPSMGDPQIRERMERQRNYYDWLTSLKLVQSYGRTIRSEEDWSVTYIIDGGFDKFYKRAQKLIPSWFKEAIEIK